MPRRQPWKVDYVDGSTASDVAVVVVSLSSVMWMAWSGRWGILVLAVLWL
jgi:hypothetical protein